jgi:hypothetical protein
MAPLFSNRLPGTRLVEFDSLGIVPPDLLGSAASLRRMALYLNRKPLLAILKRNGAWRRQGSILFVTFAAAVTTALSAWAAAVGFDHRLAERALVEVHDKVVIPMSVLFVLHVWQRRSRLLSCPRSIGRGRTATFAPFPDHSGKTKGPVHRTG